MSYTATYVRAGDGNGTRNGNGGQGSDKGDEGDEVTDSVTLVPERAARAAS